MSGLQRDEGRARLATVDALKALASQLIVLHHLAFYGPMSDHAAALAPGLFSALSQHGRLAVPVFLAVSGFLAARVLAPQARWAADEAPLSRLLDRYLRLVLPYAAMLLLAIAAAAWARGWMDHPSVPAPARPLQALAHLLLLQDVLGIEALSAGVWYVAIDFQLFALLLGLLALGATLERRLRLRRALAPWLVAAGVAASLFHFNLDPAGDVAAPYFFASFGLGVLAAWLSARRRVLAACVVALVAVALLVEFRSRIAVAAVVALLLSDSAGPGRWPKRAGGWLARLSQISYAVFLVHFPVCLLVNAFFTRHVEPSPGLQLLGVLLAWAASVAAGAAFHRGIERPALRWLARRRGSRVGGAAAVRA